MLLDWSCLLRGWHYCPTLLFCFVCAAKLAFWGIRQETIFGIVSYYSDTSFHLLMRTPLDGEAVQLDTICMDRTAL